MGNTIEIDVMVLCAMGRQMSELISSFNNLSYSINSLIQQKGLLEEEINKLNKYLEKNINVSKSKKAEERSIPSTV